MAMAAFWRPFVPLAAWAPAALLPPPLLPLLPLLRALGVALVLYVLFPTLKRLVWHQHHEGASKVRRRP